MCAEPICRVFEISSLVHPLDCSSPSELVSRWEDFFLVTVKKSLAGFAAAVGGGWGGGEERKP